jgi:hypothetical protein
VADASLRDTRVLTWIGEQRGVPLKVVPWLLGRWSPVAGVLRVADWTARRWVERVEARGLVERVKVLGEPWVLLTQHGARLMGVGWTRYGVPRAWADHIAAKSMVRLWLEDREPEGRWLSERDLWQQGAEWHRPDAAWLVDGMSVAVEVEISRKTSVQHAYHSIMERMPPWADAVWWFCPEQDRGWLLGQLAKQSATEIPRMVLELPTLDAGTHPANCRCRVCEFAGRADVPVAVADAGGQMRAVRGVVAADFATQAGWERGGLR